MTSKSCTCFFFSLRTCFDRFLVKVIFVIFNALKHFFRHLKAFVVILRKSHCFNSCSCAYPDAKHDFYYICLNIC